ncbi:Rv3235 family protein [Tersicoccus sp. Bi-70]|uniref:Rv3235 family protein n=1 Tax=Tersicoccus sp. Bi-70 TaxID=1897634 RepID=UPI0009771A82|nr:Rv3235 family protein [Tersicoccus sp. Bi-70]OMH35169.1 hypothetical protein BGP79_02370 [Tersicoccus sp. Bi-70]
MRTRAGAAAPLQHDHPLVEEEPAAGSAPPPITTRWAPAQRLGAPPVRLRPDRPASLHPVELASDGRSDGRSDVGDVATREPARVLPLEDETTRRVIAQTRAVGQAILEVLAGARPAGQLVRWMDPTVHEALVLRAELVRASTLRSDHARGPAGAPGRTGTTEPRRPLFRQATVRSVHACRVTARCYEMSLVISEPGRCRAMALRLELRHLQWRVTALQLG